MEGIPLIMTLNTEIFINRAKKIHGNKYDYSEVCYKTATHKVKITCKKCGHFWESLPHNHFNGSGCKKCQYKKLPQNKPKSHEWFLKEVKKIHKNKFEYIGQYKNHKTKIEIRCKSCGVVFEQRAGSHLEGRGCKKCQISKLPQNKPKPIKDFENECRKIHENKYEYCGDYKSGRKKIKIFCKKHKKWFKQNAGAHLLKKQGCPKCSLSKGELRIELYLKLNKIKYKYEKRFNECRIVFPLPFDFYLPNYNLCIEYDGEHHFYSIDCFGGEEKLKETQKNDDFKTLFCLNNNIDLLRIPFYDFDLIEKILDNKLRNK